MDVRWEVSIMEMDDHGRAFKVTRQNPDITEHRFFKTKRHAVRQFSRWLE
jgi:hypothetical protein